MGLPAGKSAFQRCAKCTLAECQAKYAAFRNEAERLANDELDPIANGSEVNRRITKSYADMYLRRPDFHWVGAATFVSKQMGCNMRQADKVISERGSSPQTKLMDGVFGTGDKAAATKTALVDGNTSIFTDIYPQYRLFEADPDCVLLHGDELDPKIPPMMRSGFQKYVEGDATGAMLDHAQYEQQVVLQDAFDQMNPVTRYDFESGLQDNLEFHGSSLVEYGGLLGFPDYTQPEQVSFTSGCIESAGSPFRFDSGIGARFTRYADRWELGQRALDRYDQLMSTSGPAMRQSISDISSMMSAGGSRLPVYP